MFLKLLPLHSYVLQQAFANKSILMVILTTSDFCPCSLAICQRCLATACQERAMPCNMVMCVIHLELRPRQVCSRLSCCFWGPPEPAGFLEVCQWTDFLPTKAQAASCMSGYLMSDFLLDKMKDKLIGSILPWKCSFANVESVIFKTTCMFVQS